MDVETALASHVALAVDVPVRSGVPADRPATFVDIERTGGPVEDVVSDWATFSLRCWAGSKAEARDLAYAVRDAVVDFGESGAAVNANVTSLFSDRDVDSGSYRYQMVAEVVWQQD